MYLYLSYGAADYGALYYGALGSELESKAEFARQLQSVTHTVHKNPFHGFNYRGQQVGLLLENKSVMRIVPKINHVATTYDLFISSVDGVESGEIAANWSKGGDEFTTTLVIVPGLPKWVSLPITPSSLEYLELRSTSGQEFIIQGIRLFPDSKTLWPWEDDLEISIISPGVQTRNLVVAEELLTEGLDLNIDVLDDHGYTILSAVTNP